MTMFVLRIVILVGIVILVSEIVRRRPLSGFRVTRVERRRPRRTQQVLPAPDTDETPHADRAVQKVVRAALSAVERKEDERARIESVLRAAGGNLIAVQLAANFCKNVVEEASRLENARRDRYRQAADLLDRAVRA